jgi:hypothetical protein
MPDRIYRPEASSTNVARKKHPVSLANIEANDLFRQEQEEKNRWRRPVDTNVSYGERIGTNIKTGAKNVGKVAEEMILPAAGAAAVGVMAAPVTTGGLAGTTVSQLLKGAGKAALGGIAAETYFHDYMGVQRPSQIFNINNPYGAMAADMFTAGTFAAPTIGATSIRPKLRPKVLSKGKPSINTVADDIGRIKSGELPGLQSKSSSGNLEDIFSNKLSRNLPATVDDITTTTDVRKPFVFVNNQIPIDPSTYPRDIINILVKPNPQGVLGLPGHFGRVEYPQVKKYTTDLINHYEASSLVRQQRANRLSGLLDEYNYKLSDLPYKVKYHDTKHRVFGKSREVYKGLDSSTKREIKKEIEKVESALKHYERDHIPISNRDLKYADVEDLKAMEDFKNLSIRRGDFSSAFDGDFDIPGQLFQSDKGRYYHNSPVVPARLRKKAFVSRTNAPDETIETGLHELGHKIDYERNYYSPRDKQKIRQVIDKSRVEDEELRSILGDFNEKEILADLRPFRYAVGDYDGSVVYTKGMLDDILSTGKYENNIPNNISKLFNLKAIDTKALADVLNSYKNIIPPTIAGSAALSGKSLIDGIDE